MPRDYTFECANGHRVIAYRNKRKCPQCGAPLRRLPMQVSDEERYTLQAAAEILRRLGQRCNAAQIECLLR